MADIAFTFSALSSYLREIVSNSEGKDLHIFVYEADGDLIAVSDGYEFTHVSTAAGSISQVPAVNCNHTAIRTATRYFLVQNPDYVDGEVYIVNGTYAQASAIKTGAGVAYIDWSVVVVQSPSYPAGTYEDLTQLQCNECVLPEISRQGAMSCDLCIQGYYRHEGACEPCPSNARCSGQAVVVENPGYWKADEFSFVVQSACLGGNTTDGSCAEGYGGVLCAVCQPGHLQTGYRCCADCNALRTPIAIIV